MKVLVLCVLLIFIVSCKEKETKQNVNENIPEIGHVILDSVLLNNNKNYTFINLENYENDSIYAVTYPQLELDILDKKGDLINEITKKGEGPGELSDLFTLSICDNKIFLLDCANYYRCRVYDLRSLEYITSIDFQEYQSTMFPYPLISSFNVTKDDSKYILSFAGSNFAHTTENKAYYTEGSAVAEYVIDDQFNVIDYQQRLPYKMFSSLNNLLKTNVRFWDHAIVQYEKNNDDNIIIPFFSDSIFVYDKNWDLIDKLNIKFINKKNYTTSFSSSNIEKIDKRLKLDFSLRFANRNFYSTEVYNDKVYLLYPEEVNMSKIPTNSEEYKHFSPKASIICVDLKTNNQYKVSLPKKVSYYGGFKVIDDSTIIIPSNTMYQEDLYLYRINFKTDE